MNVRLTNLSLRTKSVPLPGYRDILIKSSDNYVIMNPSKDTRQFLDDNKILQILLEDMDYVPRNSKVININTTPISYTVVENPVTFNEIGTDNQVEAPTSDNTLVSPDANLDVGSQDSTSVDTPSDFESIESKLKLMSLEDLKDLAKMLKITTRSSNPEVVANKILDNADDESIATALKGIK